MTQLILDCSTNDFLIDAHLSTVTITSPTVKFTNFVSGIVSLDATGAMSVLSGSLFSTSANYSVSGTWNFSNTVTCAGSLVNSGIVAVAGSLGVPAKIPPAGYTYAMVQISTGQICKMT